MSYSRSGRDIQEGRDKVLFHVKRLELQRPLDKIQSSEDRARAATVRDWFKNVFCRSEAE